MLVRLTADIIGSQHFPDLGNCLLLSLQTPVNLLLNFCFVGHSIVREHILRMHAGMHVDMRRSQKYV